MFPELLSRSCLHWTSHMDLLDLFFEGAQNRSIDEMREQLQRIQAEREAQLWDLPALATENQELKLRLGLLVRLLISKGIFTAAEYASLIQETQPRPVDEVQLEGQASIATDTTVP